MHFRYLLPALAIALLAQTPTAFADTTIGTTASGDISFGYFGSSATPNFGETFLSPGGTLSSFTFSSISVYDGYRAFMVIAPINGLTPGAAMYSAEYGLTTGSNTFSDLGVSTSAGVEYIAYLSTFGVSNNPVTIASFDGDSTSSYADGQFLYSNAQNDPTGTAFNNFGSDTALFSATFTPDVAVTPEPSSLMLLATGMLTTAGLVRRRGKRA